MQWNSRILDAISHYVNEFHNDWDQYISAIQLAYRSTPAENSVGYSPFFLLYGRKARLPLNATSLAKCNYPDRTLREHIHGSQFELIRDIS